MEPKAKRQECTRCVMDTSAPDISFDENGHCNYCSELLERTPASTSHENVESLINRIKELGRGKPYDCIVGVSGGVDSSYTLHLAVKAGLRPLAVHLDNGWNSEEAVNNIASLIQSLNVDLFTHVIDWKENRDLQKSFFRANVVDIEMLMDNAMQATNYRLARKYRLKYILSGSNQSTEGMRMPPKWTHCKYDVRNIRAIHRQFGSVPIKTHPLISTLGFATHRIVFGIKWLSFLDFFDYKKDKALLLLQEEHGYKPYPYKHYESVFTRFYQGHILPKKFGIDKRKVHLSTLIINNQLSHREAVELLSQSPYPKEGSLERDLNFVLKKLDMTKGEFEDYLNSSPVPHSNYLSEERLFRWLVTLGKAANINR